MFEGRIACDRQKGRERERDNSMREIYRERGKKDHSNEGRLKNKIRNKKKSFTFDTPGLK